MKSVFQLLRRVGNEKAPQLQPIEAGDEQLFPFLPLQPGLSRQDLVLEPVEAPVMDRFLLQRVRLLPAAAGKVQQEPAAEKGQDQKNSGDPRDPENNHALLPSSQWIPELLCSARPQGITEARKMQLFTDQAAFGLQFPFGQDTTASDRRE